MENQTKNELELTIKGNVSNGNITIQITLKNNSPKTQQINGRFAVDRFLNGPQNASRNCEISYRILDGKGQEVHFPSRVDNRWCETGDIIRLPPNKKVTNASLLNSYYLDNLKAGTEYEIQAFYENAVDIGGTELWKGKIESNKIKINSGIVRHTGKQVIAP